jgi:hypothetical protein
MKEFIDKECKITLVNEQFEITGKVIGTEAYWIKIQEKDSMRIVNGAMVRDIKIICDYIVI